VPQSYVAVQGMLASLVASRPWTPPTDCGGWAFHPGRHRLPGNQEARKRCTGSRYTASRRIRIFVADSAAFHACILSQERLKNVPFHSDGPHKMHLKTLLNHLDKHKSFVYGNERLVKSDSSSWIEIPVQPRKNSQGVCGNCKKRRPCHGHLPERRFEYIPCWGIVVFFLYARRRVNCPTCGIHVEEVPWAQGKETQCTRYQWFLADWAKHLSWEQVAQRFGTSWDLVYRAVTMAVVWGLAHQSLSGVESIGVDEISWLKGHKYLTLVYEIGPGVKRLLYIAKERTEDSLRGFFDKFGEQRSKLLKYVCSDMWQPYLTVISERASQAKNILDRFHIMKKFNEAIDEVRREEVRRLKEEGEAPLLLHARWCLLKRPENLTPGQATKLQELMYYNLRSVRAHLLREEFQRFWTHPDKESAGQFLDTWCKQAMRSRLEPMKKVVRMLRGHRELILNWFSAQGTMSSGSVEGMNNKAKVRFRNAYGFRSYKVVEIALYHTLGNLPEPTYTHKFR